MEIKEKLATKVRPFFRLGLICLAALAGLLVYRHVTNAPPPSDLAGKCIKYEEKACSLNLLIVDTQAERERGLSGRLSLSEGTGMLFDFNEIGRQCMWMKDMQFAIDIMWLDAEHKVIKLEENVSPATYPQNFCSDNTRYVIELNAGAAKRHGYEVGSIIKL